MKKIFLVLLGLSSGCATTKMTAASSCTFTPSVQNGRYVTWLSPGDAKCTFTLNSPITKAEDTKIFSEAFKAVMGSSPQIVVDEKSK